MLLWRQSDVLTRAQALRHLTSSAIEHRIHSGRWRRAHHGTYVAHNGPLTTQQLWWIGYLAAGRHACLAGVTAAQLCGLRGQASGRVHVLIPARYRDHDPPPGVVVHRTSRLCRSEVNLLGLPPHTTAARSLVDAAQWARTDDKARALIAAGFQQRLVAIDEVEMVLRRLTRVRRRSLRRGGPGRGGRCAFAARGAVHQALEGCAATGTASAGPPPRRGRAHSLPGRLLRAVAAAHRDRRRTAPGGARLLGRYAPPERALDRR
jgi:hypothetical protein